MMALYNNNIIYYYYVMKLKQPQLCTYSRDFSYENNINIAYLLARLFVNYVQYNI